MITLDDMIVYIRYIYIYIIYKIEKETGRPTGHIHINGSIRKDKQYHSNITKKMKRKGHI